MATDDKDGKDLVFEREIVDADVVISQPFWHAYITELRMQKSKELEDMRDRWHWFRSCGPSRGNRQGAYSD